MPKKTLKFEITTQLNSQSQIKSISVNFHNCYFISSIDFDRLGFPYIVSAMNRYNSTKHFVLSPNSEKKYVQDEICKQIKQQIANILQEINISRLDLQTSLSESQAFKKQIKKLLAVPYLLGYKHFIIQQNDKYPPGTIFLYYFKKDEESVKGLIEIVKNYMNYEELLFPMDKFIEENKIPSIYEMNVLNFFIQRCGQDLAKMADDYYLCIEKMIPIHKKKKRRDQDSPPCNSINMKIGGNRKKLFQFYEILENSLLNISVKVIQICEPLEHELSEEQRKLLLSQNINKISATTYLILKNKNEDQQISQEQIIRILQSRQWKKQFDPQHMSILEEEYKEKRLLAYLQNKRIELEYISFHQQYLVVKANKANWILFQKYIVKFLNQFEKVKAICQEFTESLQIEIFMKEYQQKITKKYSASFLVEQGRLFKIFYKKYSQKLSEHLKSIVHEIRKKIVRLLVNKSLKSIQSKITQKMPFNQNSISEQYYNDMIGWYSYKMNNVIIKAKPFNYIKSQQKSLIYLLDDYLDQKSAFHSIYEYNQIDYQSFVNKAHATKKPDRLRKYLTPNCPFSEETILFHLGGRNRTQTYERDLDKLLIDTNQKMRGKISVALMEHDEKFLQDNVPILLQKVKDHSSINNQETEPQLQIFYEGISIKELETVFKRCKKGIVPFMNKLLQKQDIYSILAFQPISVKLSNSNNRLSVIQSFITQLQISRKSQNPRLIISNPERRNDFTQFLVNIKKQIIFRISESDDHAFYPQIKSFQLAQFPQIKNYCNIFRKYIVQLSYIVIYANQKHDNIEICNDIYLAKKGEMFSIKITQDKKIINKGQKIKYQIQNMIESGVYEIEASTTELPNIYKYLSAI